MCRLDALESNAALAKMQRRSIVLETSARREQEDATRAKAREEEARRAADRAVAEARAIAERRVAEAVRDERLRAERKAREARLANAASRRRGEGGALPGSSWGAPPSATHSGADKYSPSGSAVAFFGAGGDLASFRARTRAAELESAEREAWAKAKQREVAPLERAESEEDPSRGVRTPPGSDGEDDDAFERAEVDALGESLLARSNREAAPSPAAAPPPVSSLAPSSPLVPASTVTEARARARARLAAANGLPTRTPAERVEAALGGSSSSSRRAFVGDGAPRNENNPRNHQNAGQKATVRPPRFTASERRAADVEPTASARLRRAEEELRAAGARAEGGALRRARRRRSANSPSGTSGSGRRTRKRGRRAGSGGRGREA